MTLKEKRRLRGAILLMRTEGDCQKGWTILCELADCHETPIPQFDQRILQEQLIQRTVRQLAD